MSSRMTVNLCPYCGDEDLRPDQADEAGWTCRACLRRFTVTYRGMVGGMSERSERATGTNESAHRACEVGG